MPAGPLVAQDPLTKIMRAIRTYKEGDKSASKLIFDEFDNGCLDFRDYDKLEKFTSDVKQAYWLQQYIMSGYQRAKFFYDNAPTKLVNVVVKSIETSLNYPSPNQLIDRYIGVGLYIVARQLKNHVKLENTLFSRFFIFVRNIVNSHSYKDFSVFLKVRKNLECDADSYIVTNAIINSCILLFDKEDLLMICSEFSVKNLGDRIVRNIKDTKIISADYEALQLIKESGLLLDIIGKEEIKVNEIKEIIFDLVKVQFLSIYSVKHKESRKFFSGLLEKNAMELMNLIESADFVDGDNKNLLYYIGSENTSEFVEFLLVNNANLFGRGRDGASAIFSLIYNTQKTFIEIIVSQIKIYKDSTSFDWQGFLEHELLYFYNNYDSDEKLKEKYTNPIVLSMVMPLLLKLLFETYESYENLELRFEENICLWDVDKFEDLGPFSDNCSAMLRRMFQYMNRPVSDILLAINKSNAIIFDKCLLALLQSNWVISGEDTMRNLQGWNFLAENPDFCSYDKINPNTIGDLSLIADAICRESTNPFQRAVTHKNVNFLILAAKIFSRQPNNLNIANQIGVAAAEMIESSEDIVIIDPLFVCLKVLSHSYFYPSPFTSAIYNPIKESIGNLKISSKKPLFHCIPNRKSICNTM